MFQKNKIYIEASIFSYIIFTAFVFCLPAWLLGFLIFFYSLLDWEQIPFLRSALGFLWKGWCWSWNSSTLATSCEELTHWKRLWCWEGLGTGGEGDNRGWDGWMASLTQWTWVWVISESWTEKTWCAAVHGVAKSQTRLSDWTDWIFHMILILSGKIIFYYALINIL